jgi:hypothetical protein
MRLYIFILTVFTDSFCASLTTNASARIEPASNQGKFDQQAERSSSSGRIRPNFGEKCPKRGKIVQIIEKLPKCKRTTSKISWKNGWFGGNHDFTSKIGGFRVKAAFFGN